MPAGRQSLPLVQRLSRLGAVMAMVLMALNVACDSGGSSTSTGGAPSGGGASKTDEGAGETAKAPVFGTGVVKGRIVLEGDAPAPTKIKMQGDRFCTKHNMEHVAARYEVGADNGLPHVFVYVKKGIDAKYPAPEEKVTLDQTGCMYAPHIFGLLVGQTLTIRNNDNTAHNVNALTKKNQKFNISQPQAGMVKDVTFSKQEVMVKFKCDVHGWMDAYCGVLTHPFYTVTDADGHFTLDRLPAGRYTIEVWHEMYGTRTAEVEVADGETKELDVTFRKR
ncbi:MAG TPA: carboxypeptidase regulatory-like domain-containing protein [Phycisphaerae bacterium]|nr:carboxypeptidase regulatory-like domain-containing protein [Phycisphaerae bacterium]HRW55888.1 carboxypeptidase regulatory-like domain-containing protein [Phycisphaerae bacterium]